AAAVAPAPPTSLPGWRAARLHAPRQRRRAARHPDAAALGHRRPGLHGARRGVLPARESGGRGARRAWDRPHASARGATLGERAHRLVRRAAPQAAPAGGIDPALKGIRAAERASLGATVAVQGLPPALASGSG